MATWELDSPERLKALDEVDAFPGVPDDAFAVYTRLISKLLDALRDKGVVKFVVTVHRLPQTAMNSGSAGL